MGVEGIWRGREGGIGEDGGQFAGEVGFFEGFGWDDA